MGTLFSALDIARSGLAVAQIQLDTAGHNIANVNKEGFSRQRVELLSRFPLITPFGQIGRGVGVGRITRLRDVFLDGLFRRQNPGLTSAELQAEFLGRVEDIFLEPGPNGLSGRINRFFDSLSELANNVEELPVRQSVVNEAQALASLFRETTSRLNELRTNANEEVINLVPQINSLAERIAKLNDQIRTTEVTGQPANDLRDARDLLLDKLSGLVNITVRERTDGQLDVLIAGDSLVNGNFIREIQAVINPALDPERNDLVEIQFVDNGSIVGAQNGELFAAMKIRDFDIPAVDTRIDQMAATIIEQINLIHSSARGILNYSGTITGTNAVTGPGVPLDLAGLPFPVGTGSLDFAVYDAAGALVSTTNIAITAGVTDLATLAAAISATDANITATVTAGNTLDITTAGGFSFSVANDTSGAFTALGTNGLFTGFDGRTIQINVDILNSPGLLGTGFDPDPLATGDNRAALAMADVRNGLFLDGGTSSISDFYETTIVQIGIDTRANLDTLEIERTFVDNFQRRRQSVSGVSIDEEVTFLLQFQRAFEASARVITVTDRMLDALLAMAR